MIDRAHYTRQSGIVAVEKLQLPIAIIGAGAVGSWTTLCLGKLGCGDLTVYDMDSVELHNVAPQIYKGIDEDTPKVEALRERLSFLLEDGIKIAPKNVEWTPKEDLRKFRIIISAVDSIVVRKQIFEHLKSLGVDAPRLMIDARMASWGIEIYTIYPHLMDSCKKYEETLFEPGEEIPVPCSERAVCFNTFTVAGLIGSLVAQYVNDEKLPQELVVDLRNYTLFK